MCGAVPLFPIYVSKAWKRDLPFCFENDCTYFHTLREEGRLRVFENRVLRKMLGGKRQEVTGDWRTLHSEKLHDVTSLPKSIRAIQSRKVRR
jgi:hypothetical protein